jgi:hypothetical protein
MPMSTKCQKNLIFYDIYDRFTMEHFRLPQSMILTISFFFCSRQYSGDQLILNVLSYILKRPLSINNHNFDFCVNFENVNVRFATVSSYD